MVRPALSNSNMITMTSSNTHTAASSSDALNATKSELPNTSFSQSISHQSSKVVAVSAKLSWKIDQFERLTRLYKNNKSLVSEKFFSAAAPNVVWELHVYPNGKREEDMGSVSFFLRQIGLEHSNESLLADFQIYVVDSCKQQLNICRDAKEFTHQQGRGKFQVTRDRLLHTVHPDGVMHLCCDVEYLPLKFNKTKEEQYVWDLTPTRVLAIRDNMKALYQESIFTDFDILVGGQTFKTHRCVLARNSEVFHGMFSNEMREASEGSIKLSDTTPLAVRGMLEYIYSGTVEQTLFEKNAKDILVIAEKYNIAQLKEDCERYLGDSLNVKNFFLLVQFADLYSCENLMEYCRKFLLGSYEQLTGMSEWSTLKRKHPIMVNDILEKVLQDKMYGSGRSFGTPSSASSANTSSSSLMYEPEVGEPLPKRTRRRCHN